MQKNDEDYQALFHEMEAWEREGIEIFLGNRYASPMEIANAYTVNEEPCPYMRDYVIVDDRIKEIRFDRVSV